MWPRLARRGGETFVGLDRGVSGWAESSGGGMSAVEVLSDSTSMVPMSRGASTAGMLCEGSGGNGCRGDSTSDVL